MFRTARLLSDNIKPDYFDNTSGSVTEHRAANEYGEMLVERNFHLCQNSEFVKNFKLRFNCQDPKLFESDCINTLFESEVHVSHCIQRFVEEASQPMLPLDFDSGRDDVVDLDKNSEFSREAENGLQRAVRMSIVGGLGSFRGSADNEF